MSKKIFVLLLVLIVNLGSAFAYTMSFSGKFFEGSEKTIGQYQDFTLSIQKRPIDFGSGPEPTIVIDIKMSNGIEYTYFFARYLNSSLSRCTISDEKTGAEVDSWVLMSKYEVESNKNYLVFTFPSPDVIRIYSYGGSGRTQKYQISAKCNSGCVMEFMRFFTDYNFLDKSVRMEPCSTNFTLKPIED